MKKIRNFCLRWHRRLIWFGAFTLLVWGISGILHPVMSWTGPKANKFFPPKFTADSENLAGLSISFEKLLGKQTKTLKIIASEKGPLLQVTHDNDLPRAYFDPVSGNEISNHDVEHARWLASYYTGISDDKILSVTMVNQFSDAYPSVNRLLPVYRINFDTADEKTTFVHTETNALALITNDTKIAFQTLFRALHTWNWLDNALLARVTIIACMMLTLLLVASSGIGLIVSLQARQIPNTSRRWHRKLANFVWLPVLAWSFSGFYHLLQSELVERVSEFRLDEAISVDERFSSLSFEHLDEDLKENLNSVSILRGPDKKLLLRITQAPEDSKKPITREERYAGVPKNKESYYFDLVSGESVATNDQERAEWLAREHLEDSEARVIGAKLITRFGSGYDFRNKRLPVWRIDIDDSSKQQLYIDPATGILVDKNDSIDRAESWSFSILHKWNLFVPLTGRQGRDVLIVLTLVIILSFVLLGIVVRVRSTKQKAV